VIFSNLFKSRVGNGECTIIFSKLTHAPSFAASANIIEEQAEITITWPQLKMFSIQLGTLVSAIEDVVGIIPIPQGFQQAVASMPQAQHDVVRSLGLVIEANPGTASEAGTEP
jgi:hypothetical protein